MSTVMRAAIACAVTLMVAWGLWTYLSSSKQGGGTDPVAMVDVEVPQLSTAGTAGKSLFNSNCASCHGVNAAGQDGVAPPLVHKIYEPGHHGDRAFYLAVARGVRQHHWPFGNMPPLQSVREPDVAKIITYVRELQRANGIY